MAGVAKALRAGEDRRIGEVVSHDEIVALARQFDETLDLLKLRNDEVRVLRRRWKRRSRHARKS
jgi:hypothetical protein